VCLAINKFFSCDLSALSNSSKEYYREVNSVYLFFVEWYLRVVFISESKLIVKMSRA